MANCIFLSQSWYFVLIVKETSVGYLNNHYKLSSEVLFVEVICNQNIRGIHRGYC